MLEDLHQQIERLIALYEGEKQRADFLQASLQASEAAAAAYKEQITDLTKQIETLQLATAFDGQGSPQAKARIDKLIREIDKCIRLLEN